MTRGVRKETGRRGHAGFEPRITETRGALRDRGEVNEVTKGSPKAKRVFYLFCLVKLNGSGCHGDEKTSPWRQTVPGSQRRG